MVAVGGAVAACHSYWRLFFTQGKPRIHHLTEEQPGTDFDLLPHPHLAFRTKPGSDPTHRADPGVPEGIAQAHVLCRLDLAIDIHYIQYLARSAVISHPARPDGKVTAVVRNRPHTPPVGTHAGGYPLADSGLVDGSQRLSKRTRCTGMKIDLPLSDGISLQIAAGTNHDSFYPTGKMQKGLVLYCDGHDLSEEAVGFGVPILKRGLQTVFPGEVELYPDGDDPHNKLTARYKLNLEEKIARPGTGSVNNRLLYASKNTLAGMIRGMPALRRLLTNTSNLLRSIFGWQTTYEPAGYSTYVTLTYTIDAGAGRILVELKSVDSIPDGITEIILMNEQGAHHFDQYQDADGIVKRGDQIGCWDEVNSASATFICSNPNISFSLPRVRGARLFLGRELIGTRLAWSGFGYTFPPTSRPFHV